MIKVTLPDGSAREYENGASAMDVALSISEGLARNVLAAKVNNEVVDATRTLPGDCTLSLLTWNDAEGKSTMWHSSAHLMAEAVEFFYPGIKVGNWTSNCNGFYYDVDFMEYTIVYRKRFGKIEQKMKELAKEKSTFETKRNFKSGSIAYFTEKEDPYKLELFENLEDGQITFYTQGNFTDLCRGPHIPIQDSPSKQLNYCRLQVHTGEVMKKTNN
jgi:threonyl-tRNA synthetase